MSFISFNNKGLKAFLAVVCLTAAGPVFADIEGDLRSAFASLEKSGSASAEDWFQLARKARQADVLGIAEIALERAGSAGLSPLQLGVETARLQVAGDDAAAAVAALRSLFEQGFTAVGFLRNDPLIESLAGNAGYDALIEEMTVQAYPCAHTPGFADFDFWIGEWDVHTADGQQAGSNSITREERGCVLVERWRNIAGGTGMSVNFLDLASNEWVQVWNAEGGTQINIRGGLTDEGMAMAGTIHYVANGTTAPFRALWTPLDDGRVRQYFEQSNDGGETWVPWFEGFYTRRSD